MNACLGLLCLAAAQVQSPPPMTPIIKAQNINCGFKPFPPIGCKVGPCVCDQTGMRCQWTFICD